MLLPLLPALFAAASASGGLAVVVEDHGGKQKKKKKSSCNVHVLDWTYAPRLSETGHMQWQAEAVQGLPFNAPRRAGAIGAAARIVS